MEGERGKQGAPVGGGDPQTRTEQGSVWIRVPGTWSTRGLGPGARTCDQADTSHCSFLCLWQRLSRQTS